MHSHSKKTKAFTKGASFALCFLLLAACGGSDGNISPVAGAKHPTRQVENALCEGRPDDAIAILSSEPLAGPVDRFYTALAMEKGGRPVTARKIYAALMQQGATDTVFLRCGNVVLANGIVSEEAARRLATIAQELRALDVAAATPRKLHAGLPTINGNGISASSSPARSFSSTPMAVYRPQSTSPLGRWFAHLESYKSYQSALESKPVLEGKFPALKGYIDQWEVKVAGGVVRLGVRLDSKDDAVRLCRQVKSNGDYCAVLDTNP
ncbi:MAG: hypothetical protein HWE08_06700 [Alphaproteobacteria bacterium]|nr:hypothetical protein [Alphaproteobacteria bacterium]